MSKLTAVVQVYSCAHRESGERFACKVIQKDAKMNDAQSMSTEIEIMKRLRHKHVVAMYELFESPQCLWLILELVDGGDLRSYLNQHRASYTEAQAAHHLKQILQGASSFRTPVCSSSRAALRVLHGLG